MCRGTGACDISHKHTYVNVAVESTSTVQPDQRGISGRTGVFNWLRLGGQAGASSVCTRTNLDLNSS